MIARLPRVVVRIVNRQSQIVNHKSPRPFRRGIRALSPFGVPPSGGFGASLYLPRERGTPNGWIRLLWGSLKMRPFGLEIRPRWIPICCVADTIQPPGNPQSAQTGGRAGIKSLAGSFFALRAADVQLYRVCDDLSGMLIFPMLVFGPWVFGTTETWSIWTMNIAGYALGVLLLVKVFIRGAEGIHGAALGKLFEPFRHEDPPSPSAGAFPDPQPGRTDTGGSGVLPGERVERPFHLQSRHAAV